MVAYAFHHSERSAVANGKAHPCDSRQVQFARGSAVKDRVAGENIATQRRSLPRRNCDDSAAQPLADIIVGFTLQTKNDSRNEERSKALSGNALELEFDWRRRQSGRSNAAHNLSAQVSSNAAIFIRDMRAALGQDCYCIKQSGHLASQAVACPRGPGRLAVGHFVRLEQAASPR